MPVNSRILSLVLALLISLILSVIFFFSIGVEVSFWLIFPIVFGVSFTLIFGVLEFVFFKELKKLYKVIEKINKEDLPNSEPKRHISLNNIYKEVSDYAYNKESEIQELKRMATFRRQFLADVSHELKTPIFAAQGFVHTLLDGALEDKEISIKFLKKAAKNLDGLDMLVKDLLTISHLESGDIKMHKEQFDIGELIYDVIDEFEIRSKKKSVKLFASCKRYEEILVYADYRRIYQVFLNLISNAIKYTDGGGFIHIQLEELDSRRINVKVKDNGLGIPDEDKDRIFDRFYRVDKSRSKIKGGTGLGLAIVKHIVEAHDSHIELKSTLGKGSEFSFRLG